MAESLARLSEMVTDAEEKARLLEAANCFDSPAFFGPLAQNVDAIRTRHANQHIPMVTGALRSYRGNHNPYYYHLAQNFWTMIQGRYRYAMGGVGNGEMFRQPYSQMTSMTGNQTSWGGRIRQEPTLNETCCAYNLAKLTKDLNCFNPNDAQYMDYYERVLYNQIVGSVNPKEYKTVYQYAVGLNASKPWGNSTPQESCCGGTGVENHVKYQEAAYFVGADTVWVALYLPTTAHWQQQGVSISQECLWPAEKSTIRILPNQTSQTSISSLSSKTSKSSKNKKLAMKLRVPYWATEGFDVRLNGKSLIHAAGEPLHAVEAGRPEGALHAVEAGKPEEALHAVEAGKTERAGRPSSYVEIPARYWTEKDVVEVVMPFTEHIDFGPDKVDGHWIGAFMRGPLVMAATGIKTWDEATVDAVPDLSTFVPDYDGDRHLTHYFRIKLPTATAAVRAVDGSPVDKSQLRELLLIARSRSDEQQAWNALTVKVPEYAPWAVNGFARMTEQMAKAQPLMDAPDGHYTQEEIDKAASALNAVVNTMRPGNLPELEDLDELQQLLLKARQLPEDNEKANRAISYANMVIRYVSDGSGTRDMIERATRQVKEVVDENENEN